MDGWMDGQPVADRETIGRSAKTASREVARLLLLSFFACLNIDFQVNLYLEIPVFMLHHSDYNDDFNPESSNSIFNE